VKYQQHRENIMRKMTEHEEAAIRNALRILEDHMRYNAIQLTDPKVVTDYLKLRFSGLEHEEFHVIYLDAQNRVIETTRLFRGTLTQTSVYPREVVKEALAMNAAGVVFAHNHPSGNVEASRADEYLTKNLKEALSLIDVRVLDHIIVAGAESMSFAERGIL
jgi:DNA repair protein RadC